MSDSDQCTLRPNLKPSLFDDTRTRLHNLTALICQVEGRLEMLSRELPEPGLEYDSLAELRSGMDCVRLDLLSDVIKTLNLLATLSEEELRARFEERRAWLAAAA